MAQVTILLLMLRFLVTVVSAQNYHIVSDHTFCPTETTPTGSGSFLATPTDYTLLNDDKTCLTLTQYAQLWSETAFPATIDSNISLIFDPGHHTLDSRLQIQNINNLVLQVALPENSSSISVAMITCRNLSGFDLEAIFEVSISGLEFSECQENSVRSVHQLRMEECTFQDGHGMDLRNVRNGIFERSSFINLTAFREVLHPYWRGNVITPGGAIIVHSSSLVIIECLFRQNSAYGGGAIWIDRVNISIHNSSFSSNRASQWGGAIGTNTSNSNNVNIHNSSFSSNEAPWQGGAIWTQSGNVNIYDSDFISNQGGAGGAIWTENSDARIHGSSFCGNQGGNAGGAIRTASGNVNIHSSNFSSNKASYGAIVTGSGNVNIYDSNFNSNQATGFDGGAIRTDSGNVNIHGSCFSSNKAVHLGGAISTRSGNINIYDSNFNNETANQGGAIFTFSGIVTIHDNNFNSNEASYGSAIWTGSGSVNIHGSNFNNNEASSHGGAIWTNSGSITIIDSNFSNNIATFFASEGGAIRTTNGSVIVHDSNFRSNSANNGGGAIRTVNGDVIINNSIFSYNTATRDGGAIWISSGSIRIQDSSFNSNTANSLGGALRGIGSSITINHSDFTSNRANRDGGAILTENGNIMINDSNLHSNTIGTDGGVIWTDSGSIKIHYSDLQNNMADRDGGTLWTVSGSVNIDNFCNFSSNTAGIDGGAIGTVSGSITIHSSTFDSNRAGTDGGAIWTDSGSVKINGSDLQNNMADRDGGTLWTISGSVNTEHFCNFSSNRAGIDGGAIGTVSGSISIDSSTFDNNKAGTDGGAIWTDSGSVSIQGSDFSNNTAETDGGAIWTARADISIHSSNFSGNTGDWGGVLRTDSGYVIINRGAFIRNRAHNSGGVLFLGSATGSENQINNSIFNHNNAANKGSTVYVQSRTINLNGNIEVTNNSATAGVVYALKSTLILSGYTIISGNRASIYAHESNIKFYGVTNIVSNSHRNDTSIEEGGAITAFLQSEIGFYGTVNILHNKLTNGHGGAILSHESNIYIDGNTTIAHNTAQSGGGIYAYHSDLNFAGHTTISGNVGMRKGGGIYAIGSAVRLTEGELKFVGNRARRGGGICLQLQSRLYIRESPECFNDRYYVDCVNQSLSNLRLDFTNNSAVYGGALFISDEPGTCSANDYHPSSSECFLQVFALHKVESNDRRLSLVKTTFFEGNSANMSGRAIFGGLLDRCTISPHAQVNTSNLDGKSYLTNITNLQESDFQSKISSETVGLCFCNENNRPDCDKPTPAYTVRKGEAFSISLVAVDHVRNPVPSTVRVSLSSSQGELVRGQEIQNTTSNCTKLNFTITSPGEWERLMLYAEGPCSKLHDHTMVHVTFAPCDCPVGFVRTKQESTCSCECDPCLFPDYIQGCSPSNLTVKRKDNIWISSTSYRHKSQNECHYLTYPHCPFDYCHPPSFPVWINLNQSNGLDAQCAFNRTGKLCGSCKDGLSVSLGSSHCTLCSNNWLALLIVFAVAGITLVAFLLVFNLTVAVGTINGLIFYANLLATNRATFFPFQSPNFFTVFIAWLNLDFGFVTCFFDGMDGYVKEWLQLAFPIYIIFLVTMVIIGCEYSTRIARLFTGTNPVATLATLILLSYAKCLRIIIAAFSSATLNNLDGSQEIVWLIDGNIRYFEGKHFVLLIAALLILLVGIVYTSLLFSYQWLLRCPNRKGLRWIKNARFFPFMDAYLAPYNLKHRYWTGLLLLIRAFLYIVAALNVNGDPGNILLVIFSTLICVPILMRLVPGRVYKSWKLDALNFTFIMNLIFLSFGSLYIRGFGVGNQKSLAYASTSIAFITFLVILTYHTYVFVVPRKVKTKLKSLILKIKLRLTKQEPIDHEIILVHNSVVTYSVVDPVPTQQLLLKDNTEKIEDEPATSTEPSSASMVPEQTIDDKISVSTEQIGKSVKEVVNIELEPRDLKFSDIPYIRDSDELGSERETEINDFTAATYY